MYNKIMFYRSYNHVDDFPNDIKIETNDIGLIGLNTKHGLALRELIAHGNIIPPEHNLCLSIGYGKVDLLTSLLSEKIEVLHPEFTIFGMYDFFHEGVFKMSFDNRVYYFVSINLETAGGAYVFCQSRDDLKYIYNYFSKAQVLNETNLHLKYEQGSWAPHNIPFVDLNEVLLPAEIKDAFLEDIDNFFTNGKEVAEKLGIPHKRGSLLIGSPGCGKSSILKGLASTGKYQFRYITGRLGPSELPDIFDTFKNPPHCVVVFEDLDVLLQEANLSDFLNMLDGQQEINNTYFIGTTNHPEDIDEALLYRPSRFDRKFIFGLPTQDDIEKYFKYYLYKINVDFEDAEKIIVLINKLSEKNVSYASLKEIFTVASYKHYEIPDMVECFKYALDIMINQTMKDVDSITKEMKGKNSRRRTGFRDSEY